MAANDKSKSKDPSNQASGGGADVPAQKRTRGPRKPKAPTFTADDLADFATMNESMLAAEKAKGERADDDVLARLFARRQKLRGMTDTAKTDSGGA